MNQQVDIGHSATNLNQSRPTQPGFPLCLLQLFRADDIFGQDHHVCKVIPPGTKYKPIQSFRGETEREGDGRQQRKKELIVSRQLLELAKCAD